MGRQELKLHVVLACLLPAVEDMSISADIGGHIVSYDGPMCRKSLKFR